MAATKRRLGVWMRLWIVLTVLWILGAGMTMFIMQANDHSNRLNAQRELCEFLKADNPTENRTDCWAQYSRDMQAYSPVTWPNFWGALGIAAVGAAFVWFIGTIGYFTVRWILAGRYVPETEPASAPPSEDEPV